MSDVLKEYSVALSWEPETMPIPALLVMKSMYSVGIGSSRLGEILGQARHDTLQAKYPGV
jgi:hypothetical protein